jgi:hypothetical protein
MSYSLPHAADAMAQCIIIISDDEADEVTPPSANITRFISDTSHDADANDFNADANDSPMITMLTQITPTITMLMPMAQMITLLT